MDKESAARLLRLRKKISDNFNASDWSEAGLISGWIERIDGHPRLLRSMRFGDDDYEACVSDILIAMFRQDLPAFELLERWVGSKYQEEGVFVSSKTSERKILFSPSIFNIPECSPESDLASVMMSFDKSQDAVLMAIQLACQRSGFRCQRADDVWNESVVMQDVFGLIFRSHVVITDFTNRNSNVFYEAGIAHTLGKHVIPITQDKNDIPFDLRHHRYIEYQSDHNGLLRLTDQIIQRLQVLSSSRFGSL